MTKVVSFINMKGGVGKTTLSVNVAYALAYFFKKRVLIVDVDPQFNTTQYLVTPRDYVKIDDLWQYAKKHPRLEKLFEKSKSVDLLENDYAVFSRFVHSTSTSHMNLTKSLSEIGFDGEFFKKYVEKVSDLAGNIHFILFAFYQKALDSFSPPWKSFLLDMIPKTHRRLLWKDT